MAACTAAAPVHGFTALLASWGQRWGLAARLLELEQLDAENLVMTALLGTLALVLYLRRRQIARS